MGKFNNQRAQIRCLENNNLEITGTLYNINKLVEKNKNQFYRGEFTEPEEVISYKWCDELSMYRVYYELSGQSSHNRTISLF